MKLRLRDSLAGLYPRWWRARYGDEFAALLEESLRSPIDVIDIFLGALDAHLGLTPDMNWRSFNMYNKLRTTIALVFAAYIGFVIGGLSLYGLVDDSPAAQLMKTDAALRTAWNAIELGSVIALLAVIVGGLPLALAILRRALTSSRRELRLLLVPVAAFLALMLYGAMMAAVAGGALQIHGVVPAVSPDNFPPGNKLLLGGFMLTFILGAIASTAAVWKLVNNGEAEESAGAASSGGGGLQAYEHAFRLGMVVAGGMLLMLFATLAFGGLAFARLPDWFAARQGLLLTNTSLSFGMTVAIMILSSTAALIGLKRGSSARRSVA
jgi:hypothetical protein